MPIKVKLNILLAEIEITTFLRTTALFVEFPQHIAWTRLKWILKQTNGTCLVWHGPHKASLTHQHPSSGVPIINQTSLPFHSIPRKNIFPGQTDEIIR